VVLPPTNQIDAKFIKETPSFERYYLHKIQVRIAINMSNIIQGLDRNRSYIYVLRLKVVRSAHVRVVG
jgi:hypothetical protein